MTTIDTADEPALPVIDATPVALRHIVRADPRTPGAVEILPGFWWAPAADDGITGDLGWVSASVERRVRDAAQLQGLVLPNAAGTDGMLHRERFAVRTDPTDRLGTEWLEFTDEQTGGPLAVVTPETVRVEPTTVNVSGPDGAALLSGFREPKVAPWTPHAPQDLIDWYSRAQVQRATDDFRGSAPLGAWGTEGQNGGTIVPTDRGVALAASGPDGSARMEQFFTRDRWSYTAKVGLTLDSAETNGGIQITVNGTQLDLAFPSGSDGAVSATAGADTYVLGDLQQRKVIAAPIPVSVAFDLQIVAIEGWAVFLRDGAVIAQLRRNAEVNPGGGVFRIMVHGAQVTISDVDWQTTTPLLRRAAPPLSYRVPGVPTPGGLRGDYFQTYDEWANSVARVGFANAFRAYGAQVPAPLAEPYAQRLDPTIAFSGSPPTWQPPGPPNGEGFTVRWSGSIRLPLGTSPNVRLRLNGVDDMAQVWVGDTRAGMQYLDQWGQSALDHSAQAGVVLRDHLGETVDGWFPIVIEFAQGPNGGAGLSVELTTDSTTWTPIGPTILSPYGCFEGDLGSESYRGALDAVCNASGLLWQVSPKTLESGEFPGRLEAAARLGTDHDYILGEDEATEYASEIAALDVADRIVADAQGLGDNLGREGLTATTTDPDVVNRPWVLTRQETLSDITEQTLLQQRLATLLALYGSPAETIAARPRGLRSRTVSFEDAFPTTGNGQTFWWEPDDGLRVRLPSVGVDDHTPRAITTVTWPLSPRGRGAPTVGFRQRPRHARETIRRLQRAAANQRRRYQGQLTETAGALGGTSAVDAYSRLYVTVGAVATLSVRVLVITGNGTIEVNGVDTGIPVTRPGDYDVTGWIPPGTSYLYARLAGTPATHHLQLVATSRI